MKKRVNIRNNPEQYQTKFVSTGIAICPVSLTKEMTMNTEVQDKMLVLVDRIDKAKHHVLYASQKNAVMREYRKLIREGATIEELTKLVEDYENSPN